MPDHSKDLEGRLERAESIIEALREQQVDAVVGKHGLLLLRLREMEEQLRRDQARLALALEGGEVGLWDRDLHRGEMYWSRTLYALLDRDLGRPVTGETFFEYVHPEDLPRVREHAERWFASGGEFRVVRDDGQVRWFVARGRVHRDEHDRPARTVGVNYDTTERKAAEDALRDSERRYRLLFDRNPDGVFAVDAEGRFTIANPACEAITGYMAEELRGMTFMQLCAPDRLDDTAEQFRRGVAEPGHRQLETALIHKDGRRVELWVAGEAMLRDGEVVGIHCTAKDITERKQAEQELRSSYDELSRFNRAAVGREMRMIELKKEVNALLAAAGEPPRYRVDFEQSNGPGRPG